MSLTDAEKAKLEREADKEASIKQAAMMDVPRSPHDAFELPCGYVDDKGVLHRTVYLREMTMEQEDLLTNQKMPLYQRLDAIFQFCVMRLGTLEPKEVKAAIRKLPIGDRDYLFFALRRRSLGDQMPLREKCPYCEATHVYMLDLSQLPVIPPEDPLKTNVGLTLPSGKHCVVKRMTGEDEQKRDALKKRMGNASLGVYLRLAELNGGVPQEDAVKLLGSRDRDAIRAAAVDLEGGLNTTVEIQCKGCEEEFERNLELTSPGFLYPSETLASWKRKYNSASS